jgi:hypothetical protein
MNIICKPCFPIDTVCALARNKYCRDDIPEIKECIDKVTNDLEIINSDWGLNDALFQKMNWSLPEIEKMSLEDLKSVLPDAMNLNSHILPSKRNVGIALDRLIESDYTKLWNDLCLPLLNRQSDDFMKILSNANIDILISDINLTRKEKIDNVVTYLSYFMEGGIGLTSGVSVISYKLINVNLMIHELLHGFINDDVTELYNYICENDEFQKKTRWYLSNRWGSGGSEEEFVIAMEHYITVKNGIETLEKSQKRLNNDCDKSVPLAVILFNELIKESAVPENYNAWLAKHLKDIIGYGDVQKQADTICSDYSSSFLNYLSEYKKSKCAE